MTENNRLSILKLIRTRLKSENLGGIIVPHGDEYQNEFVPAYNQRLRTITGFTGSAGFAVITHDKAVVMSDGRYSIQLKQEIDQTLFETNDSTKETISGWILKNCEPGTIIGYDPWLMNEQSIRLIETNLKDSTIKIRALENNLIDDIWTDRPPISWGDPHIFPLEYAGLSAADKISAIQNNLNEANIESTLITLPDSVSWCLNIRSNDVEFNPIFLGRLLVFKDKKPILFIDNNRKLSETITTYLENFVDIKPIRDLEICLSTQTGSISLDPQRSPHKIFKLAQNAHLKILEAKDHSIDAKAQKNQSEQNAMRNAHKRDAAAIIKFLAWLDEAKQKADLSELIIADRLENFRREAEGFKGNSFNTICGWNENGAIIHYRATPQKFAVIPQNANGVLLLDSGGQYKDGTTDITRTLAFGAVPVEIKKQNTAVLKGMIALSKTCFPLGITGAELDAIARKPLHAQGLDYAHGTGHGVGCYLSVHEEATGIHPRSKDKMLAGMIVSNEPGYYQENSHGIRIENLILCIYTKTTDESNQPILAFETLTLVPFDRDLIDVSLLDDDERKWINQYHARILSEISPMLPAETIKWLSNACKAL